MKILFITATYLGDAIISTGLLETLRKQHPEGRFTVVCGPIPAPLFSSMPQLEQVITLKKKRFSLHWFILWAQCLFNKWDLIVDLRGTGLSPFLWAKKRHIWKSTKRQILRVHQIAQLMNLQKTPPSKVHLKDHHYREAKDLLTTEEKLIFFSPAANWDKKCWPLENFEALALRFQEHFKGKVRPVILGAPSQRHALVPLIKALPNAIDLVGKTSLPTLAACLSRGALFVGNDSGLMHLAAAQGIPTLGLFGPSPHALYAPWGEHAHFIRTKTSYEDAMQHAENGINIMDELSVDVIFKKSLTLL